MSSNITIMSREERFPSSTVMMINMFYLNRVEQLAVAKNEPKRARDFIALHLSSYYIQTASDMSHFVYCMYYFLMMNKIACIHQGDTPMLGVSVHIFPSLVARQMDAAQPSIIEKPPQSRQSQLHQWQIGRDSS